MTELFPELEEALTPAQKRAFGAAMMGLTMGAGLGHLTDRPNPVEKSVYVPPSDAHLTFRDADVLEPAPSEENSDTIEPSAPRGHDPVVVPRQKPKTVAPAAPAAEEPRTPSSTPEMKAAFVAAITPLVRSENSRLAAERRRVEAVLSKANRTPEENDYLAGLMRTYRVPDTKPRLLLDRLAPLPPSLVVAQAALESGWGRSRLAQVGNVLFGQKTWTGDNYVKASDDGTKYAAFEDWGAAVRAYMRNLNSHDAYSDLRAARSWALKKNQPIRGHDLAKHLTKYSTRGKEYVDHVRQMIASNKLGGLDGKLFEAHVHDVEMDNDRLDVRVYENPTFSQCLKHDGRWRALIDHNGDLYVWNAYDATHDDIINGLGVSDYSRLTLTPTGIYGEDPENITDAGMRNLKVAYGGNMPKPSRGI